MFACFHLPDFAVEAVLFRRPDLRCLPCAVVADERCSTHLKSPLLAVNTVALRHGIRAGMSSAHARTHCPALHFLARDPEAEQQLHTTLLDIAESLSPDFECLRPDTLIADLTGSRLPHVWNPPIPRLRLVFADTPDLAHLAAMVETPFSSKPWNLPDFDPLPLAILPLAGTPGHDSFLPVLHLWGLRSLGEFRHLPRQDIAERIGPDAILLHDILHGKIRRPLRLQRSIESFVQIVHFENPIEFLEALLFQANKVLQTLCTRLESNYRAAGKMRFSLLLESSERLEHSVVLPEPLGTPTALLRPLHTWLDTLRLPSGIVALELELEPVHPLAAQREWLGRQLRQPTRWPDTLARLEALLGPGRVGIPQPVDSLRPDAFHLLSPSGAAIPVSGDRVSASSPLPLRRFRPPLEVAVASSGPPARPRPLALLTGPHAGRIAGLRGPFPLSGDWWAPDGAWRRLEWDIMLETRHLFRLVLIPPDHWLLDGSYS